MKRYRITLGIDLCGKKITAIKDIRGAVGLGLLPSKTLCETPLEGSIGCFGGELLLNADQLCNIVILTHRSRSIFDTAPLYYIIKVEEYDDGGLIDCSHL